MKTFNEFVYEKFKFTDILSTFEDAFDVKLKEGPQEIAGFKVELVDHEFGEYIYFKLKTAADRTRFLKVIKDKGFSAKNIGKKDMEVRK